MSILKNKKQIILQGAPGTGKTYLSPYLAVKLIDEKAPSDRAELMKRYKELVNKGQIFFTTFHQSMDYEEFVEGIKPIDFRQITRKKTKWLKCFFQWSYIHS